MDKLLKKSGIFLQARINSNRMPGKCVMPFFGNIMLHQVLKRLEVIPADEKVILTTPDSEYAFRKTAKRMGWKIFTGDEQNVLKRYVEAAVSFGVDIVIRATADNPFVSPEIAIETIDLFHKENCDLATLAPVPYGSGIEVVKTSALITALKNSRVPHHLEHVTPYIYENSHKFKVRILNFNDKTVSRDDVRLTVDTEEDFQRMNYLYRSIVKKNSNFKIKSIINIYDELKFVKYKRLLVITAFSESYGMGHLKKVMLLAKNLQSDFQTYFSFKQGDKRKADEIKDFSYTVIDYDKLSDFVEKEGLFERIIVDLRDTSIEEMRRYKALGSVISFDDMGEGGQISDLNFKTMPALLEHNGRKFNYEGMQYLLTDTENSEPEVKIKNVKNILITFGGSDPAGLTEKTVTVLNRAGYNLTVITGPFNEKKHSFESENCKVVKSPDNLHDFIGKCDMVFTSFGVTFFESLLQNKPVIIINPTEYHDRLTSDLGYPYFIKPDFSKPDSLSQFSDDIIAAIERIISENSGKKKQAEFPLYGFFSFNTGQNIKEIFKIIKDYSYTMNVCPNCSSINEKVIYRTKKWNMVRCPKCGLYYTTHLFAEEKKEVYGRKYFFDEYKEQYGRTYIQDKENIQEFAKRRLKIIKNYVESGRLLDFGSALGFFSEYAELNGFKTLSLDKSKFAVNYIQDELKLDAVIGGSEYLEKNENLFDAITCFYVIEHIKEFKKLLFLFSSHLKKNGVLAISTPNASGISIRHGFNKYVQKHPDDHYIILSPSMLKSILKDFGFGNFSVVVTGIHPERFFTSKKALKLLDSKLIKKLFFLTARLLKLGDTFEIYAEKIRD
jgi:spore coat polysaccharide biosynthesis protein SpsF (cytidylyltransferase family)/spore coat polysaccharide biosynthesis predicted glycosyltransferase SpsG/SAM-dependent methyltransferase/predicted RNA-binding Zn-ribbon protein involved in translation (DUF1610 family)